MGFAKPSLKARALRLLAQREGTNTEDLKRSLAQIGRSSMRATHTVNQLLALARAESAVPAMQGCNLVRIVTDVVQDCLPRAMDKHIDLGYEGASASTPGVWLNGNATLLTELVRHLPRHAVLDAARSLHALRMQKQPCEGGKMDPFGQWWIYLCQTAGLVEAERASMPQTYQFP